MRFEYFLKEKWFLIMLLAIKYVTLVSSFTECTWCQVPDCQVEVGGHQCFCRVISERRSNDGVQCENVEEDSYLNIQNPNIYRGDSLEYFIFVDSQIRHLRISLFTEHFNFEFLYLDGCGIEEIQAGALSSVTSVTELYLQENLLYHITMGCFNFLFNLKILDLHSNRIKSIEDDSFHGLSLLENLDLADNNLTNIPVNLLTYLYNLKTFNISRNSLKAINFQFSIPSHIKRTSESRVGINKHRDFSSEITKISNKMVELDLSYNQIREIPLKIFNDMRQLSLLNISKNDISDFKIGTLSNLKSLNTLDMHSLNLATLDLEDFVLLTQLKELNIQFNRLKFSRDILNFCPNLKTIAMDGNEFLCSVVTSMIMNSKLRNITMKYTPNYNDENIDGIPCIRKMEMSSESIRSISSIIHDEIHEAFQGLLNNISSLRERDGNISELNPETNLAIKPGKVEVADTQLNDIFNLLKESQNSTLFEESLSNLTMIISLIKSTQDENTQKLKQIEERKPNNFNDQLLKNISRKLDETNTSRDKLFSNFLKAANRIESNNRSVENQTISLEELKKINIMVNKLYSKLYYGNMNLENNTYKSISEANNSYNFEASKSVNESVFEYLRAAHKDPEENMDSVATKMDFLIVLSVICYFTMFLIVAYIIGEKKLLSKFKNGNLHEEACNEMSSLTN